MDACRYLGMLLTGALGGTGKDELLAPFYSALPGYWEKNPLTPGVAQVAGGSFKEKEPPEIVADPIAALCLEAALWPVYKTENFEDGCLLAVNLGNDSDTTAAVYGQPAGAFYGLEAIPSAWLGDLCKKPLLFELADGLADLAFN